MSTWLTSYGTLYIGKGIIRLAVSMDFCKYYKSLVDKDARLFTHAPAHGCHITIYREMHHGLVPQSKIDRVYRKYGKGPIKFEYDIDIIRGGNLTTKKVFKNWFMHIRGDELTDILNILGIQQNLHLTISNTKGGERPYIWLK